MTTEPRRSEVRTEIAVLSQRKSTVASVAHCSILVQITKATESKLGYGKHLLSPTTYFLLFGVYYPVVHVSNISIGCQLRAGHEEGVK